MTGNRYKYDVAFSFLTQDEPLATQLNDLLQDRVRTFLYSKKQGEIAGTDGEKTFNLVFAEQSRLVVVLYRKGWGQTPWTRIEETAIRNRAHEHGYDFAIFIPLDESPAVPKWLPRTQIWVGLKRWGLAGAASVIEARIEELGGEPHEETVQERATRLDRSMKFDATRKQFLHSEEGVNAANKEFQGLCSELERLIASVNDAAASVSLELKATPRLIVILGLRHGLSVHWHFRYINTLEEAELDLTLWDGHPPTPDFIELLEKPRKLMTTRFTFDLLPTGQVCWFSASPDRRGYATKELACFILKYYMDHAQER